MKYMLLMYAKESSVPSTPESQKAAWPAWNGLQKEMEAAGVLLSTSGLSPVANATTVRVREGKTLTTDGPFAETHEQLGGYFLIEARDLNDAIQVAARIPGARIGGVEVRPVMDTTRR